MATGLLAVVAIVVALVASARVKWLTRVFGIGSVYGMHRWLGLLALGSVGLHIVFVLDESSLNYVLLFPWSGTNASKAADVSTLALLALIGSAMWRRRRNYDLWRNWHIGLTTVIAFGVTLHVVWLDNLITDPVTKIWFIAVLALAIGARVYRWAWGPFSSGAYTIVGVNSESPTTSTVTLAPRQGRHRPNRRQARFAPGQFGWLRLTRRPSMDHPYSFSSSAQDAQQVQVTVKRGGLFTERLVSTSPGQPVWVDGPHGGFTPPANAVGLVLIAAGVGITPMMSILRTCADRRDRRPIRLIQAAESPQELLFTAEIDLLKKHLNLQVTRVVTRKHLDWAGLTGHINLILLDQVLPGTPMRNLLSYFLCGPPAMVSDTSAALTLLGVPPRRVHTEQFLMPSPKGHSRAPQHARPPADDVGPRRPRPQPHNRNGVGPAHTAPIPVVRPGGAGQRAQPELHPRGAAQPPVRGWAGDPVRTDRDGPAPRPMQRGEPGAERVRGGDHPRPHDRD